MKVTRLHGDDPSDARVLACCHERDDGRFASPAQAAVHDPDRDNVTDAGIDSYHRGRRNDVGLASPHSSASVVGATQATGSRVSLIATFLLAQGVASNSGVDGESQACAARP